MKQKLSAMKYIKNNKWRVAVLIVSLSLCFVLTYLTNFMLSSTEETFRVILLENTKSVQYVRLAGSSLGIDVKHLDDESISRRYGEKNRELVEKLKKHKGVKDVMYSGIVYNTITAAVGSWGVEIPLTTKEETVRFVKHYGAEIVDGRMPEKPGEVVLDRAAMKNIGYELGEYFNKEACGERYQIVGVLDSERYLGCGIPTEDYPGNPTIVILSDGSIEDVSLLLKEEGIIVRETYDEIFDRKSGAEELKTEIVDIIGVSTTIVYVGILILLSISLFIVYSMYLRDRHNEWCLYCSIGYSRKEIYYSILRELFFTFAVSLIIGAVIIILSMFVLDFIMMKPQGLRCRYFSPETLGEILCAYMLLIGLLQIPVRYALYRIRTIDAMDEELY